MTTEISLLNAQLNKYASAIGCFISIISILIIYFWRNHINGYIYKGTLSKAITATLYFASEAIAFETLRDTLGDAAACYTQNVISMTFLQIGGIGLIYMKLNLIPNIPRCIRWIIYIFCIFLCIRIWMTAEGQIRIIEHSTNQQVCENKFPPANLRSLLMTNMILLVLGLFIVYNRSTNGNIDIFKFSRSVISAGIVVSSVAMVIYYFWWKSIVLAAIEHLSIASKLAIVK